MTVATEKTPVNDGARERAEPPFLTVAIPCFDEESILPATYQRLKIVCEAQRIPYEIIFGDDGSTDRTLEIIRGFSRDDPRTSVTTHFPNRGLGNTYRDMYRAARGEVIMTMDCDLAMSPEVAVPALLLALKDADMAVGSRYAGVKADYPLKRRIFSWGYIFLNRVMFDLKLRDTQTGSVAFYRKILSSLKLEADGPEMLVELFAQAGALGLTVAEVALPWIHDTTSGETPVWKTSAGMLAGNFRVRRRLRRFKRDLAPPSEPPGD